MWSCQMAEALSRETGSVSFVDMAEDSNCSARMRDVRSRLGERSPALISTSLAQGSVDSRSIQKIKEEE